MLYHISIGVRDMLEKSDDFLCDLYRCEPAQIPEVRTRLVIALMQGHKYIPLHECDNFDPQNGCKGHPAENQASFMRFI
jgi:hypothetical protein